MKNDCVMYDEKLCYCYVLWINVLCMKNACFFAYINISDDFLEDCHDSRILFGGELSRGEYLDRGFFIKIINQSWSTYLPQPGPAYLTAEYSWINY